MRTRSMAAALLLSLNASCGAIEVPAVRAYRLTAGTAQPLARPPAHVLRVQDLRLAAHVSPEHVMVTEGAGQILMHPLDQWAGPLDRMITDVVVTALRRSGAFADVKASTDVGREDFWLAATVTDFSYERRGDLAEAVVGFDVQVRRASDFALVLARDLTARAPAAAATAPAAVQALGRGVQAVVEDLVAACATLSLETTAAIAPPPGLAVPPSAR